MFSALLAFFVFSSTPQPGVNSNQIHTSPEALVAVIIAFSTASVTAGAWIGRQLSEKVKLEFKMETQGYVSGALKEHLMPLLENIEANDSEKKAILQRIEEGLRHHSEEILIINKTLAHRQELHQIRDDRIHDMEGTLKKLEATSAVLTNRVENIQKFLETSTNGNYTRTKRL